MNSYDKKFFVEYYYTCLLEIETTVCWVDRDSVFDVLPRKIIEARKIASYILYCIATGRIVGI